MIISLPDPIQPFANASYKQKQDFFLSSTSSAIIVDSFSGGRSARGEHWDFDRYTSINSIYVDGELIIKDSQHLIQPYIKNRMHPFHIYAMLFLIGDQTKQIREDFEHEHSNLKAVLNGRFDIGSDVLWTNTCVNENASVVRLAGKDEEIIKLFLRERCKKLESVIGVEAYFRCFK